MEEKIFLARVSEQVFATHTNAFGEVRQKVLDIEAKIANMASGHTKGDDKGHDDGFMSRKSLCPKVFGKDKSAYRRFRDDMLDYMEACKPGMRRLLRAYEKTDQVGTADLQGLAAERPELFTDRLKSQVYIALKACTEGDARTVVESTNENDGLLTWRAIHMRYSATLAAEHGRAYSELGAMNNKPAKTPEQTKGLIIERDRRARHFVDVTGREAEEGFKRARW